MRLRAVSTFQGDAEEGATPATTSPIATEVAARYFVNFDSLGEKTQVYASDPRRAAYARERHPR